MPDSLVPNAATGRPSPSNMSLAEYIHFRLGDENRLWPLLRANFVRSFTAPSLADFWRYWNPVYGYYLAKLIYRPLRRRLPRALCVLATFAVSGFLLHDVFSWPLVTAVTRQLYVPHTTAWFLLVALLVLAGEAVALRFDRLGGVTRVLLHVAVLVTTYWAANWVTAQRLQF